MGSLLSDGNGRWLGERQPPARWLSGSEVLAAVSHDDAQSILIHLKA